MCFQVSSLIAELASAAAAEKGIIFEPAMDDRLCAYSRAVAHFPTAVKEVKGVIHSSDFNLTWLYELKFTGKFAKFLQFKWRNGWFYSLSEKANAEGKPDPCPLHTAWLKEINAV